MTATQREMNGAGNARGREAGSQERDAALRNARRGTGAGKRVDDRDDIRGRHASATML
jgi:hypothetical protein